MSETLSFPRRASREVRAVFALAIGLAVTTGMSAEGDALPSASDAGAATESWPQFRGPRGAGVGGGGTPPVRWSKTENVAWVREIPGRGWSSPVVHGDRLFLTTAVSRDSTKEPGRGLYGDDHIAELVESGVPEEEALARTLERDIETSDELESATSWYVIAFEALTGVPVWQRRAHVGTPPGGRHRKNTHATETPATDGERVYALFGNLGLWAYTIEGDLAWNVALEPHAIYLDFGTGASPVVDDEHVYVLRDNEEISTITAFDKRDGRIAWSVERRRGKGSSGWATPLLWESPERRELVTVGARKASSYAPASGELLWTLDGIRGVPAPTPIGAHGMVYFSSGAPSEPERPLIALRPGASGDLSIASDPGPESVAWIATRGGSYIPTPIVVADTVYVLHDKGFFAAHDARSGHLHYRERLDPNVGAFTSSPWAHGEYVFVMSEDGEAFTVRVGPRFEVVARSALEETCLATPAIAWSSHYVRTASRLYRIASSATPPPASPNPSP